MSAWWWTVGCWSLAKLKTLAPRLGLHRGVPTRLTQEHDGFQCGEREAGGKVVILTQIQARERKLCLPYAASVQTAPSPLLPCCLPARLRGGCSAVSKLKLWAFSSFIYRNTKTWPINNLPSGYKLMPRGSALALELVIQALNPCSST